MIYSNYNKLNNQLKTLLKDSDKCQKIDKYIHLIYLSIFLIVALCTIVDLMVK
jgi:hypothetical protein